MVPVAKLLRFRFGLATILSPSPLSVVRPTRLDDTLGNFALSSRCILAPSLGGCTRKLPLVVVPQPVMASRIRAAAPLPRRIMLGCGCVYFLCFAISRKRFCLFWPRVRCETVRTIEGRLQLMFKRLQKESGDNWCTDNLCTSSVSIRACIWTSSTKSRFTAIDTTDQNEFETCCGTREATKQRRYTDNVSSHRERKTGDPAAFRCKCATRVCLHVRA